MLTSLRIDGFKRLEGAEIPLGEVVVFIGPNNSGKTTALQALTLWDLGFRKWAEKRRQSPAKERTGVPLNRKDLVSIPVPGARFLWRDLRVREAEKENGTQRTRNVVVEIGVEGVTDGEVWQQTMVFDFANDESFYCRAKDWPEGKEARERLIRQATRSPVAYLPPMSGLATEEFRKETGEIAVRIGEGRTAEVLRNLCYRLYARDSKREWESLCGWLKSLFQVELCEPEYLAERSEIRVQYREQGQTFDLACAGRGFHQVLLLLAYLYNNPKCILLLDEPDAHLEMIRQREIYQMLTDVAREQGAQIIAASHSEVILNEAAEKDVLVAFVGKPHRIDVRKRSSQVAKALKSIRHEYYYLAEKHRWLLFLEGATDLSILRSLAGRLTPTTASLQDLPVRYVEGNEANRVRDVFYGLKEAVPELKGIAVMDRLPMPPEGGDGLWFHCWKRREIENYIVTPRTLEVFAQRGLGDDVFGPAEAGKRVEVMKACIRKLEEALETTGKPSPWSPDSKITDDFLDPLMKNFYGQLGLPQLAFKRDYHVLAEYLDPAELDTDARKEIETVLLLIGAMEATNRTRNLTIRDTSGAG